MLEKELNYIKNEYIKQQTVIAISHFPEYFAPVSSSSSGKYHAENESLLTHTRRDAKVAKDIIELKMFELSDIDKDLIISALILHDCRKRGVEYSEHTVHEHPILSADLVREYCDEDFANLICPLIERHSGQWTTSTRSSTILPEPETKIEKLVHLCDYIASRRYITINLED